MNFSIEPYKNFFETSIPISQGYGEYLVYSPQNSEDLTIEKFSSVFQIFNSYVRNLDQLTDDIAFFLETKIKKIDPNLNLTFIPKTLYELLYIEASLEEEKKEWCFAQGQSYFYNAEKYYPEKKDTCWHLICGCDGFKPKSDNSTLIQLAYRFNRFCLDRLNPKIGHFTGEELVKFTEKQINILELHAATFPDTYKNGNYDCTWGSSGVAINFGLKKVGKNDKVRCYPMGISEEQHKQTIRNAVALECSKSAENAWILYRAGDLSKDVFISPDSVTDTSLSYGRSLFAGCVRDGTATVFHYLVHKKREIYALIIPLSEYADSPFLIPKTPALVQLLSEGEFFHPRSKLSLTGDNQDEKIEIKGIWRGVPPEKIDKLKSSKSADELARQINDYHQKSYLLTSSSHVLTNSQSQMPNFPQMSRLD